MQVDAQVADQIGAAERHEHEAARHQQGRGGKRGQVAWLGDGVVEVHPRGVFLLELEVAVHRLHLEADHDPAHCAQRGHGQERDMPVPGIGEIKPDRNAQHLAGREGRLDDAHDASPQLRREQIGGDGQRDGTDHAPEQARDDTRDQQTFKTLRQTAPHGPQHEAGIEEQQEPLAVEAVGKTGREQARGPGAEGIRRYHQPELLRRDLHGGHDHGTQGRHQHEIENDRKLQEGQQADDGLLVARESRRGGRTGRLAGRMLTQSDSLADGLVGLLKSWPANRLLRRASLTMAGGRVVADE